MTASGKLRGWLRSSRRHSADDQRDALKACNPFIIYEHGKATLDQFINDLRAPKGKARGDVVLVTTLGRLAPHFDEITKAVRAIHKRGAVILETTTGMRSDNAENMLEMLDIALHELRSDKRTHSPERAAELGAMGGKARAANAEINRTAEAEALVAWRDLRLSTKEALDTGHMRGWTQSTAYSLLKKRNTAPGSKAGRTRKSWGD